MAGLTKAQTIKGISLPDAFLKFEVLNLDIVQEKVAIESGLYATQALSSSHLNRLHRVDAHATGAANVSSFITAVQSDSLAKAAALLVKAVLPDWAGATEVGT